MSAPPALTERPRLLMVAYACRPNQGSEPGMGWNRAVEAARVCDTWVLCEASRSGPAIRAHCEQHGEVPGLNFAYVPQSRWGQVLAKIPGLFYLAYNLWHRRAAAVARRLHEKISFDLAHQVTYCGYREPGYVWRLPIPFVWGPIGGTHNYPWRFLPQAGWWGGASELFRSAVNTLQFYCTPRIRRVAREAAVALAGNSTTQRHFREAFGVEMPLFPASGIGEEIGEPRTFRGSQATRLLWCGTLHPLKGLPLLLQALAQLPAEKPFELRIVGDGPYRKKWEALAQRLGIADCIEWTGWIPHREAIAEYQWADVLVYTSLRDTFPTVVLEALAAGLPVICLDHLGMGDIVTSECGLKIPLTTPREAIAGFRHTIEHISSDSEQWDRLSRGAIDRTRQYTWSHQGRRLAEIYEGVRGQGSGGRNFRFQISDFRSEEEQCSTQTAETPIQNAELKSKKPESEIPNLKSEIPRTVLRLAMLAPLVVAAYVLAWLLRYDFALPGEVWPWVWSSLPWVLAIKLAAASTLRGWHEWMRYVSFRDLVVLAATLSLASAAVLALEWFVLSRWGDGLGIPLSVVILDFVLSLLLIGGACSAWRFRREHLWPLINFMLRRQRYRPALLVGANRTGVVLANQIQFHPQLRYHITGFLDADASLHGTRFGGVLVQGGLDDAPRVALRCGAKDLFVIDGSLPGVALRRLLAQCRAADVRVRIIANIYDLVADANRGGRVAVRDVDINDLLRREPVAIDDAALGEQLRDQVVLVTGAGGSIGSEICRQVLRYQPRLLALVERAENSLFQIERELLALGSATEIVPLVADITDLRRMRQVFETCRPHVVFHAAAHKHVPMMEANPSEALANNVFGTRLVADLADQHGVRAFVLISTDKAVRPTSVMGLSKQIAERYVQSLAQVSSTKYVVVRFGNVLGSAGSVVPIFQEQIARGGPITVTHPEMRRYFMTIPEASQLVMQGGAMGAGGEIFVLDMGEPVRILDLAQDLIRLSGLSDDDIEIKFTGIRPGEKLYEELYFDEERTLPTPHPKLRVAHCRPQSVAEAEELLSELQPLLQQSSAELVRSRLRELCPEYCATPASEQTIVEPLSIFVESR